MATKTNGLDFDGLGWDWRQAEMLASALPFYASLTHLSLQNNRLDSRVVRLLAMGFSKCPVLLTVVLDGNQTIGDDGAEALADAFPMPEAKALTWLSLCDCKIKGRGARALTIQWYTHALHHMTELYNAGSLGNNPSDIPCLRLDYNSVDTDCRSELSKLWAKALAESVFPNAEFTVLDCDQQQTPNDMTFPAGLCEQLGERQDKAKKVEEGSNSCQKRRNVGIDVIERSPDAVQQKGCCVLM
jgi:hypothetical protein